MCGVEPVHFGRAATARLGGPCGLGGLLAALEGFELVTQAPGLGDGGVEPILERFNTSFV